VLWRRERRRSSSASDDEIGGFLARLREQLYRKDDDMREVVDGVIQIAIGYVNAYAVVVDDGVVRASDTSRGLSEGCSIAN
jgi:hypothetical protein